MCKMIYLHQFISSLKKYLVLILSQQGRYAALDISKNVDLMSSPPAKPEFLGTRKVRG